MHLLRVRQRAGADRVQARLQRLEQLQPAGQRQLLGEGAQHIDQLPAPQPILQLGLAFRLQQALQVRRIAGKCLQLLRSDLGNFQVCLQGFGQWHGAMTFKLDHRLAIELHQCQQLFYQGRAVARPHAQGIAGSVTEAAAAQVEDQLAGFLAGAGAIEQAVFHYGGHPGLLLAERRYGCRFTRRRRRCGSAQCRQ
ncbi:hypothetical protein D3C75_550720 [compost metagenome]